MRIRTIFIVFVTSFLAFAVVAQAASVEKLTLGQMVKMSPRIVVGTVTDVSSAWNENHTQVFTTVTVDVSESLKGSASGAITFQQVGGVVGDIRVSVPGFPVFRKGSELLLFLNNDPSGHIPTVGLGQGKFDVFVDDRTGEKMVANDVLGLEMLDAGKLTEASTMRMSLSSMKESIKEALESPQDQKN